TRIVSASVGKTGISFEDLMQVESFGRIGSLTLDGMDLSAEQLRQLHGKHPKMRIVSDDRAFFPPQ
ncbi:MAG: hypothetical protein KDA68_20455, partial [Planctomycetaceae bacterium]|nr:hypothetical protein [Planctomycetaceae bacterium]